MTTPEVSSPTPEQLAEAFIGLMERLAPEFGHKARRGHASRLLVAAFGKLLESFTILRAPEPEAKPDPKCDRCGQLKSHHSEALLFCPFHSTFRAAPDPSGARQREEMIDRLNAWNPYCTCGVPEPNEQGECGVCGRPVRRGV